MQKKKQISNRILFERKRWMAYRKDGSRLLRLRGERGYNRRPSTVLLRMVLLRGMDCYSCRRNPLTQFEQGALKSYQFAKAHKPVEAYRLAQRVLAYQPHLAPLVARTALVLAQEDVPLEGLDLIEKILSLGYTLPQLTRAYARILGSLGYHKEALFALRNVSHKL